MFDEPWVVLLLGLASLILLAPVLAFIALARVQSLERRARLSLPENILARLEIVERELREISRRLEGVVPKEPAHLEPSPPSVTSTALAAPPEPVTVAGAPPPMAAEPAAAQPPAPAAGTDLETRIAGRWLNRVGIVALLLAVAFFLKYAFDNAWVGPRGRVAIGLLAGVSLLAYSQWLLKRGYRYFSDGIAGLGAGALYLSLYAAWDFYQLIPNGAAFAGMVVVTAAILAIAVGRDSQRIALLGLLGGFLTPALVSTGKDAQIVLFSYLALLNAGLLVLARLRAWRSLALAAFAGTTIYYWVWVEEFYSAEKLVRTALFATVFFLEFAAMPVLESRQKGKLHLDQILLVLLNATCFLVALGELLYEDHRWALTVAVLLLAAAHLGIAHLLKAARTTPGVQYLFAGLALTFVTLAIPIRLEGKWITLAWAVEGTILAWSGFRAEIRGLRWAGLFLEAVVGLRLLMLPIPAHRFLWNARFGTFASAMASYAASFLFAKRHGPSLPVAERRMFEALGLAVNGFAVWTLSMEVWDFFGRMRADLGVDTGLAQQLALSLVWTLYATGLMVVGVRRRSSSLRWQGLVLFGLAVGKAFLYDLASLERVYRIVSFVVLGVVLLVVSFLYQRRLAAGASGEKP